VHRESNFLQSGSYLRGYSLLGKEKAMFHEVFHFVLVNGVRVVSAILPAAPLLGQKLPPVSVVKNNRYSPAKRNY
jgi:hypothetical protein